MDIDRRDEYPNGRRMTDGTCLFHKECHEKIISMDAEIKKRVPIWVFVLLVGIMVGIVGGIFIHSDSMQKETMEVVKEHIDSSDRTLTTIEFRQRLVMQKLKIPGYADPVGK